MAALCKNIGEKPATTTKEKKKRFPFYCDLKLHLKLQKRQKCFYPNFEGKTEETRNDGYSLYLFF